jgi:NAD(P)-dependent dehydrogenase (short-subunit alcohol dehydrogenase family)
MPDPALKDRVAIITGAARGIGLAAVRRLCQDGARVVAFDRPEADFSAALAAGQVAEHRGDVVEAADWDAAIALGVSLGGRIDILFNNAGIGGAIANVVDYPEDDFDRVMAVNVRGVFNTMKAWLPGMVSRGSGSVVNLASTAGLEGLVDRFAYSVSKHAVVGITRSAALDHARSGVRINCLCPGRVETPFVRARIAEYPDPAAAAREMASTQAMGRMGQPQEIANAALFLASDAAAFITGVALPVDGGWTAGMFPKG